MESPCQSKDDVPMDDVPSIAHGKKYEAEVPSIVSQGTCDEEMTSVANAEKDLDFSQLSPLYAATRDFNLPKERGPTSMNNFLKGALFSPDGFCLLTASEDSMLRVFEVPRHTLQEVNNGESINAELNMPSTSTTSTTSPLPEWVSCLQSVEGETVYDFSCHSVPTWILGAAARFEPSTIASCDQLVCCGTLIAFASRLGHDEVSNFMTSPMARPRRERITEARYPHMSSAEPASCVFISTSRDHPIHMWDAFTGGLRATYRAYDHLDEIVAANSVCFNVSGDRIFGGYNRMIRVFDVAHPGRTFEARPTCKTRKSTIGQRGIISSLAFSPQAYGGGLYAAGSYAKSVCLYSENSHGRAVADLSTPTLGGITQLQFSPDGQLLFSGSRKSSLIFCWDVRQTREVLHTFRRGASTNQRISFDIDASGRFLATGSTDGEALVYDIHSNHLVGAVRNQADAVGGACFHPYAPLLSFYTGQRHFDFPAPVNSELESSTTGSAQAQERDFKTSRGGLECANNGVFLYSIGRKK